MSAMAKAAELPYRPCVGIVLVNSEGLIFAGQRIDGGRATSPPDRLAWQMPQGGIDEGETPKAAALRELWEETGVTADLVEKIAKTADWLTYDLPDELIGKVWGVSIAASARNGSCCAISAPMIRSASPPPTRNSRPGAGSGPMTWSRPSCRSNARSMSRWWRRSGRTWPDLWSQPG